MPEIPAGALAKLLKESAAALAAERSEGRLKPGVKLAGLRSAELFRQGGLVFLPRHGRVIFFGDVHGDLYALEDLLKATRFEEKAGKGRVFLVGLGDYVDRGPDGVGVMVRLLGLRKKFGPRVVLVRGDHENVGVNEAYGFADELRLRYGKAWRQVMGAFRGLYSSLPHVVVTGNGIVAVHGGVPEGVNGLSGLAYASGDALTQILWNDSGEKVAGFAPNWQRGGDGIKLFGKKALEDFLDSIGARVLVRAHEWDKSGETMWGRLATVFSTDYGGRARRVYAEADLETRIRNARDLAVKDF